MKKPVLLVVDDDPQVLSAIDRDLRSEFRRDYRVLRASSGAEALEILGELTTRAEPLALLLADQRMPGMEGVELLEKARGIFPDAKRVLLTAYADTEAAIRAINNAYLDYYLLKPWDPPQDLLYPTLHDLLAAWQAKYKPRFQGLRLIGFQWSPLSHELKDFLAGYMVAYQWLDFEATTEAETLLQSTGFTPADLPVVIFEDGSVLARPERAAVALKIGLAQKATAELYDVVVIGAGPAGMASAVYGASEGLKTLVIERGSPGGQAGSSSRIENYLGFPTGLSGAELAHRAWAQAVRLGAELLAPQEVTSLCVQDEYKVLTLADGSEVRTRAVVLATGVSYRTLNVPGEHHLSGAGVYYGAARTEARSCDQQDVYIVGGGNSAGQAAMYLATYARRVFILIRGESLAASMSAYLIEQIGQTENIEILSFAEVKEVCGQDHLEEVIITNNGQQERRPARALFVFIGAKPSTEWVQDIILCDKRGFMLTGRDLVSDPRFAAAWKRDREPYLLETCVPGIFAAGDTRVGAMARVASAVGEGSMAIKFVHEYLDE
ncbi:response regulator receiver modulated FAD-dependent pyridine nucleotide-disulphide oxidoreductase [Hymenobacter roseosalivarius DSM 11622]|uniref:Response regulator receiver modulated FAD-dependent pyridine nucleotide-disulphide oxidoreductase n=1 Tax=Hymenobacter roseosalivarius DSM 11622 TaxID=645990 RepID=A0A1W1UQ36_9BACT|nr:FAD-dependent oxidoreductase [Hymenobacter roseosalivarius]SMB83109.1 response regulator receiver modulated FAD-dependent pyridine nucleotide-disulphide oxidoreductase [Hymenobacter roseosalivarius DSM 11622]